MLGYENIAAETMGAYMELYVQSLTGLEYYVFSNYIEPLEDTEQYVIYLKRENNIYSLQLLSNA